jgi:hypothetical protein
MRKVKVSEPYSRYLHKALNSRKASTFEANQMSHLYPTPGCLGHEHPRRKRVFKRHVAQGNKTNMLYWRMHKDEYKQLTHG